MKIFILIIGMFFVTVMAHADYYIINLDTNRATSKTKYKPSASDLALRNEIAIESDSTIPIDMAEYRNGKIEERIKSSEEKNKEKEKQDKLDKKNADFASAKIKLMNPTWTPLTADEVDAFK